MKTGTVGRPYKPDADKGTVRVELRLTPKQAERLNTKVEQSNLTTSAFIRQKNRYQVVNLQGCHI